MALFKLNRKAVLLALCVVALTLGGCGKKEKPSPYHAGNYPGKLKIGKPYTIDGKVYYPSVDHDYDEQGVASWYGPGFHGRSTANGERFDQNAMTAAHRTLPLPSKVRVTNLENGKTAILKVNDRGPFKHDRIIDLSKAAAKELGVIVSGTANVRVQYLPHETEQMIADLVRDNALIADQDTLKEMGIGKAAPDVVLAANATDAPRAATGFGVISSAQAAEPVGAANPMPMRGIDTTAPVRPVATRTLSAPTQAAAPVAVPSPREAGGMVPAYMPAEGRNGAVTAGNQRIMPPELQASTHQPVYQDDAPLAPTPQAVRGKSMEPLPQEITPEAVLTEAAPLPGGEQPVRIASVPKAQPSAVSPTNVSGLYVQAGSFSDAENAYSFAEQLSSVGNAGVKSVDINGRTWYRVRVGPVTDHTSADGLLQKVINLGHNDARIVRD